ncbi:hypothetical protein RQP46_000677 [Phenoliferia psychrophenolica]
MGAKDKDKESTQPKLSSFFKPSQGTSSQAGGASQPKPKAKRPAFDTSSDVIVLDSSDTDEPPPTKQPKLEHANNSDDAPLAPIASTSSALATATTGPAPSGSSSQKVSAAERVVQWRFDENAGPRPAASEAALQRRDAFAKKLLAGPNLLQRKSAYIQAEDPLAARDNGSYSGGGGDDDDEMDVDVDPDEDEDEPVVGKGKGKAPSRLDKFAAPNSKAKAPVAKNKGKGKEKAPAGIKWTPLEKQVLALKEKYPGVVLMFEVGYKYRFFQEDAQVASKVLGIAAFPSQHMMTASIPTHRLNVHVKRLINAGQKVGVCNQQETAALKKVSDNRSAPFTRALSHLYTSATYIDELHVDPLETAGSAAATLMCLVEDVPKSGDKVKIGMLAVLPSTGEVIYDEFEDGHMRSELETRMLHLQPSELVLQKSLSKQTESMVSFLIGQDAGSAGLTCRIERIPKKPTPEAAQTFVSDFYVKAELHKILDLPKSVLIALASLITHLRAFSLETIFLRRHSFVRFADRAVMHLNGNTLANLEILRNQTDFKEKGSLLSVLDHCKTSFGRRLLRRWVSKPLVSLPAVLERQEAIAEILANSGKAAIVRLRELFRGLPDLERGLVRLHFGKATPLELVKVLQGFQRVAGVLSGPDSADGVSSSLLKSIVRTLPCCDVVEAFLDELNTGEAREGAKSDLFKEAPDSEELEALQDAKDCLVAVEYEMTEELAACRKLLKKPGLEFVKIAQEEFLIEVRIKESAKVVPDSWVKINSTKAVYRYRSPAGQKKLAEIEQARERVTVEADLAFRQFLSRVADSYEIFRAAIASLATADCLFSLALAATAPGYCRPSIVPEPGVLEIVQGRHPMVEVHLSAPFVPNDVSFGGDDGQRQMILTGLNMGGKSSLSRSVALIALMAQIGSYVPADSCTTSLFDGIFTRMGASDELARGRSTFMVELSETSEILKLATPRSLIILDELGRGTSTMDGQAIAGAVLQHIVEKLHALTIFITHYPQLAEIGKTYPEVVKCHHMACLEGEKTDGVPEVTFLYSLKSGLASRSHGLNVARMAELPESVLKRAFEKSRELEESMAAKARARVQERLRNVLKVLVGEEEMKPEAIVAVCRDAVHKGSL